MDAPPVLYARSGDVAIAYQVTGEGPEIVLAPGTASHLALNWDEPRTRQFIERFSSSYRLIRFDKRGTGLSDRVTDAATLEERADDIRAVMDATHSERAVILGVSEGGQFASVFAAAHPERVQSLIVWGCAARWTRTSDYPWGLEPQVMQDRIVALRDAWPSREYVMGWGAGLGPDADPALVDQVIRRMQASVSPSAIVALEKMNAEIDIRSVLPIIRVPTLVMCREQDPVVELEAVRDLATRIPGSRFVSFPGKTHYWGTSTVDPEPVFAEIESFITGRPAAVPPERFLTTVVSIDLVGSTQRAVELGDRGWRDLLNEHYRVIRRELARGGGSEIDTAGDGLLAIFDGPTRAVRFALDSAREIRQLGLRLRAGVHSGEVERSSGLIRGIAVVIASRIAALGGADDVLVSTTVRDLTAGSGLQFEDRGSHELKGVPEARQVLRVRAMTE